MSGFFKISEDEIVGLKDKVAVITGMCFSPKLFGTLPSRIPAIDPLLPYKSH